MPKYRIAEFNVELASKFDVLFDILIKEYKSDFEVADISFSIEDEDIINERKIDAGENEELYDCSFALAACLRKLAEKLIFHNSFVLHSATFDVDGVGVSFAAHSGTGKTTHMNLWQELLGEKMTVVNGDKPIVRFFDDEPEQPYAYGTPWNGKERLGCNMRTALKHICFIERSETNYVERLDKALAIDRIFNQVYMPKNPIAAMNTMKLIDRLLSCCNLWIIHCNMEKDAAKVAYETIFGK